MKANKLKTVNIKACKCVYETLPSNIKIKVRDCDYCKKTKIW